MLRILASVAALALATPAAAEDDYWWNNDNWSVSSGKLSDGTPFCTLLAGYVNDDYLSVHFEPTTNKASLAFEMPMVRAGNFAPSQKHTLEVKFVVGEDVDEGWGERDFWVSEDPEDNTRSFVSASMEAEVLLNDFARADTLAFTMYDAERIIAVFQLSGSALAISKIRECGYSRVVR